MHVERTANRAPGAQRVATFGGPRLELTPGERLIMSQLRDLYGSTSRREHPLGRITSQWPAMHVEAYRGVLGSLLSKNLLEIVNQGQALRITDAGMRAMGLVEAAETKTLDLGAIAGGRRASAKAPPASPAATQRHQAIKPRRLGLVAQLVFIALAASAIVLLWLVLWPR